MNLYSVKSDIEASGKVRPMKAGMTPATVRLFVSTKPGDRARNAKLAPRWQDFVKRINPNKKAFNYATGHSGGWVNQGYFPTVELLCFEGNVLIGEPEGKKWVKVKTFALDGNPPSGTRADLLKYFPYLIHRWNNIKRNGSLRPGKTFFNPSYIIVISPNGFMYVETYKLQLIAEGV